MKNKMRKIYDFGRAVASILSLLLFLLCGVTATAQNREISGTVLDETGQPAIGATVVVKGTNSMTITGLDGQFRLSVPKDAGQLEISYVGYETAKLVLNTGKSVYNVKLKVADLALDEVVVSLRCYRIRIHRKLQHPTDEIQQLINSHIFCS